MLDISATLKAKSDQLNAEDLLGGPIVVRIERVQLVQGDQPVAVHITGHKPWKPCKTQRRLLARLMGVDASKWAGRWMELHNDPSVTWAGEAVGGIRLRALSGIPGPVTVSLAVSKRKRKPHTVVPLDPPDEARQQNVPPLDDVLAGADIDPAHFDRYMRANGSRDRSAMSEDQRTRAAAWLMHPKAVAKVKDWAPTAADPIDVGRGQAANPSAAFTQRIDAEPAR